MRESILKTGVRGGSGLFKEWLISFASFALIFVGSELLLHLLVFGAPMGRIIYPIFFGLSFSALITELCFFLPPGAQKFFGFLFAAAFTVWILTEYLYYAIFGAFMPVSQLVLGGNVADFRSQLLYCVKGNMLQILILLLPLALWLILAVRKKILRIRLSRREALISLITAVAATLLALAIMFATQNSTASVYRLFMSTNTNTTISYKTVGVTATTVQELRFMRFGDDDTSSLEAAKPEIEADADPDESKYNALPIDFEALAASTDDPNLKLLDNYFSGIEPTKKNDYTGLLKGGNVIVLCAESFSPLFISPELTPTLYKMANNGFVFNNFYGVFKSVTTNGEYTTCTGLFPDLSRDKVSSTFDESIGNYLPYCLGNALKDEGYLTYAYHNYVGTFYNRNLTHTNMGYTFKSAGDGLDISMQWPASDLEMMEESTDDYILSDRPFVAYYMTFSGHYQYDWYNTMSVKNRNRVKDLPYSDVVKAYIACNLELEDALTYLIGRLEERNLTEKTLIVLTNDHYPYGLQEDQYNELAGHPVDTDFEKYHNSFLCYTEALDKPVTVDDYCCTADILPTILNLIGYDYDSRLIAGKDVLSDAPHVAILETGSFLTNDFRYNADTGVATRHDGTTEVPAEETEKWIDTVTQRMVLSREILNHDYYRHVFPEAAAARDETVPVSYSDITSIFAEAAVSWVASGGYMDPVSETRFGAMFNATLEELLNSLYRIAGEPEDYEAIPSSKIAEIIDYSDTMPISEDDPSYPSVCWAVENGLIKEGDREKGFSPVVNHMDTALIIYRFCHLYQSEFSISQEGKDEATLIRELSEQYPQYSEEELKAIAWCLGEHIIMLSRDINEQIDLAVQYVTRESLVTHLFRTCVYELHMD